MRWLILAGVVTLGCAPDLGGYRGYRYVAVPLDAGGDAVPSDGQAVWVDDGASQKDMATDVGDGGISDGRVVADFDPVDADRLQGDVAVAVDVNESGDASLQPDAGPVFDEDTLVPDAGGAEVLPDAAVADAFVPPDADRVVPVDLASGQPDAAAPSPDVAVVPQLDAEAPLPDAAVMQFDSTVVLPDVSVLLPDVPTPRVPFAVLEAEAADCTHNFGRAVEGGWTASPNGDPMGLMVLTPYLSLPAGEIEVTTTVIASGSDGDGRPAVGMRGYDIANNVDLPEAVYPVRTWPRQGGAVDLQWRFNSRPGASTQLRVFFYATIPVTVDRIVVDSPQ